MSSPLPTRAQVVVVGGGVVGCSVAYHLAKRGWSDVVLLERKRLTSGTTWHAAGLITQARSTHGLMMLVQRSLEVFRSLESETGLGTGYRRTGTVNIATTEARMEELLRQASTLRASGITVDVLGPEEAVERWPLMDPRGLLGGTFFPEDARGNPTDTTQSLAKGARMGGAQIFENSKVTGVRTRHGRVDGVTTDRGDIEAEFVVNCTGMWGREFGALAGARLPLQAAAHYYIVTDVIPDLPQDMPTLKGPDEWTYVKDDAGKLLVGFFEPGGTAWASAGIPEDAEFQTLPENWEHLGPFYERVAERIPILQDTGVQLFFSGPESFTPDGFFHFGEVPRLRNYFVAAGFNSTGFLTGPGAGKVLADWIVDGHPPMDLAEVDPRRVMSFQVNRRFLAERIPETLGLVYDMHWPFRQYETARGIRRSPLHDRVAAAGACFGELAGWERANWYAPRGIEPRYEYTFGRPNWWEHWAEEHRAVREGVGLFELSSFGKILVQGRDAERVLQRISANDVGVEPGRIVYTQWCNQEGGIEADLTVTRLSDHEFLVMTAAATVPRELEWLRRNIEEDDHAFATDVGNAHAMLAIMGPRSRELLQPLTDAGLSNEGFPFGTSREIDLGYGFVRANRITYVGELGWELLIPADQAVHIYDTVVAAGAALGLRHAGYHALNSLRIEKAYRSWGHDIGWEDTPLEAGLGFAIAWDEGVGFIGRDALERQRDKGLYRRLVQFALDDPEVLAHHNEPIYRDGVMVGRVSSAMYGHTLGRTVALGYVADARGEAVTPEWVDAGSYEIEVATRRHSARASLRPLYDPKSERVRT